jgi:hypothetical protein
MKKQTNKTISLCIAIAFIVFTAVACSKDDDNSEFGTVNISFSNKPSDTVLEIFTIENTSVPIYSNIAGPKLKLDLNFGNYVVKPYSPSLQGGVFTTVGFQLNPSKKSANIYYDSNRVGSGF